jgi:hypothetical protein
MCEHMSVTTDPRSSRLPVAPTGTSRKRRRGRAGTARLGYARLHLLAGWNSGELDRRLAAGVDPETTDVLALRAERITTRRGRTRVANGLTRALRSARHSKPGLTAARPCAPELIAAGDLLAALDVCLRRPEPVSAQGVAILRILLTDQASALYQPSESGLLAAQLRIARAALESF